MPAVQIITGEWARGRENDLIDAVQSAMVSTIKIPEWDRDVIVDLYDAARRAVPSGKSERYTRIEIKLFSGRSIEAKRGYIAPSSKISLCAGGGAELETKIILVEVPMQNWGLRGGKPGSDIEIGFKVEVKRAPSGSGVDDAGCEAPLPPL